MQASKQFFVTTVFSCTFFLNAFETLTIKQFPSINKNIITSHNKYRENNYSLTWIMERHQGKVEKRSLGSSQRRLQDFGSPFNNLNQIVMEPVTSNTKARVEAPSGMSSALVSDWGPASRAREAYSSAERNTVRTTSREIILVFCFFFFSFFPPVSV
jgi:hypothetical protein